MTPDIKRKISILSDLVVFYTGNDDYIPYFQHNNLGPAAAYLIDLEYLPYADSVDFLIEQSFKDLLRVWNLDDDKSFTSLAVMERAAMGRLVDES